VPTGSNFMLLPERGQLLLSYHTQNQSSLTGVSEFVNLSDLKTVRQVTNTVDRKMYMMGLARLDTWFSKEAYLSSDQKIIYDGLRKTDLGTMTATMINVIQLLSVRDRSALSKFEHTDTTTGKVLLPISFADSKNARALLIVSDRDKQGAFAISVDLEHEQLLTVFSIPSGHVQLSPDGRMVVVEETSIKSGKPLLRTGVIHLYDGATGRFIGIRGGVELAGSADNHNASCIDPDGNWLFYISGSRLYWVNLKAQEPSIEIKTEFLVDQWTKCVLGDK